MNVEITKITAIIGTALSLLGIISPVIWEQFTDIGISTTATILIYFAWFVVISFFVLFPGNLTKFKVFNKKFTISRNASILVLVTIALSLSYFIVTHEIVSVDEPSVVILSPNYHSNPHLKYSISQVVETANALQIGGLGIVVQPTRDGVNMADGSSYIASKVINNIQAKIVLSVQETDSSLIVIKLKPRQLISRSRDIQVDGSNTLISKSVGNQSTSIEILIGHDSRKLDPISSTRLEYKQGEFSQNIISRSRDNNVWNVNIENTFDDLLWLIYKSVAIAIDEHEGSKKFCSFLLNGYKSLNNSNSKLLHNDSNELLFCALDEYDELAALEIYENLILKHKLINNSRDYIASRYLLSYIGNGPELKIIQNIFKDEPLIKAVTSSINACSLSNSVAATEIGESCLIEYWKKNPEVLNANPTFRDNLLSLLFLNLDHDIIDLVRLTDYSPVILCDIGWYNFLIRFGFNHLNPLDSESTIKFIENFTKKYGDLECKWARHIYLNRLELVELLSSLRSAVTTCNPIKEKTILSLRPHFNELDVETSKLLLGYINSYNDKRYPGVLEYQINRYRSKDKNGVNLFTELTGIKVNPDALSKAFGLLINSIDQCEMNEQIINEFISGDIQIIKDMTNSVDDPDILLIAALFLSNYPESKCRECLFLSMQILDKIKYSYPDYPFLNWVEPSVLAKLKMWRRLKDTAELYLSTNNADVSLWENYALAARHLNNIEDAVKGYQMITELTSDMYGFTWAAQQLYTLENNNLSKSCLPNLDSNQYPNYIDINLKLWSSTLEDIIIQRALAEDIKKHWASDDLRDAIFHETIDIMESTPVSIMSEKNISNLVKETPNVFEIAINDMLYIQKYASSLKNADDLHSAHSVAAIFYADLHEKDFLENLVGNCKKVLN